MSLEIIRTKIYEVRGLKVMLDFDLATLYEVETKSLNLAVKRNLKRFPVDFMFQLTNQEYEYLRFQNETSSIRGGRRYLPHAFTEQGVAMLSGILRSDIAVNMNIAIMRAFVEVRKYVALKSEESRDIAELKKWVEAIEKEQNENLTAINDLSEDVRREIDDIYLALSQLAQKQKSIGRERKPIGYNVKRDV